MRSRPRGFLRLLARLPIALYHLHLGWLLGHRFLLLIHQGRKTGRRYQVVVEVVRYDPAIEESIVVSGWGERADWYRNICVRPALDIQTGRDRYRPVQRILTPDEVYAELTDYERRHPQATRVILKLLGFPNPATDEGRLALASSFRMVAFRPANP